MVGPLARAGCLAAALAAAGGAARAECRLALALGLDVSSSVDAREYQLQTEGLAAALLAPEVRDAFLATPGEPVALLVFEWSGWQQQMVRQDWVTVETAGDLDRVAARLLAQARSFDLYPTAIGFALIFGGRLLSQRTDCDERTLDLSGDGTSNDGVSPEVARRDYPLERTTVNGLVIGRQAEALGRYYRQFVIQGPGAFVERADGYEDFERAMRRKLLRELGVMQVSRGEARLR